MRNPIDTQALSDKVTAQVDELVNDTKEFTAFDVTKTLRAENPGLEIEHNLVRAAVNTAVQPYLISGSYDTEMRDYNGSQARVFVPVTAGNATPATSNGFTVLGGIIPSVMSTQNVPSVQVPISHVPNVPVTPVAPAPKSTTQVVLLPNIPSVK